MKNKLVCCIAAILLVTAMSPVTQAQRPGHYYPARPTFSTYLLYRQFNGTGIPNYYQYVQPATQFRDFVNRTEVTAGRRQVLSVEQQVERAVETSLRQRETTGIGQIAVPAQFGDTGNFFERPPVIRRR
jgi:hypothetical protein